VIILVFKIILIACFFHAGNAFHFLIRDDAASGTVSCLRMRFPLSVQGKPGAFAPRTVRCGAFALAGVESDFSLETSGGACHFAGTICAQATGHFFMSFGRRVVRRVGAERYVFCRI